MYGVERDGGKEKWSRLCMGWKYNKLSASKYSDIASGGEIFISNNVYKNLSDENKEVWIKSAKYKGTKLFQGYVVKRLSGLFWYELGNPVKIEEDNTVELDTASQLAGWNKGNRDYKMNLFKERKS